MGATATRTAKAGCPRANPAGCPSTAAGHKLSNSETRPHPRGFPCAAQSPNSTQTRAANSTAPHAMGRFPEACRRAGRNHGV